MFRPRGLPSWGLNTPATHIVPGLKILNILPAEDFSLRTMTWSLFPTSLYNVQHVSAKMFKKWHRGKNYGNTPAQGPAHLLTQILDRTWSFFSHFQETASSRDCSVFSSGCEGVECVGGWWKRPADIFSNCCDTSVLKLNKHHTLT